MPSLHPHFHLLWTPAERTCFEQSTQTLVNRVPETTEAEFNSAVSAASKAYEEWSQTSIIRRQRVIFE